MIMYIVIIIFFFFWIGPKQLSVQKCWAPCPGKLCQRAPFAGVFLQSKERSATWAGAGARDARAALSLSPHDFQRVPIVCKEERAKREGSTGISQGTINYNVSSCLESEWFINYNWTILGSFVWSLFRSKFQNVSCPDLYMKDVSV
jgi:hypothetical protein